MTLTLPADIEKMLQETAYARGASSEQIALETLRTRLSPQNPAPAGDDTHTRADAIERIKSGYYARLLGPSSLAGDKVAERGLEERRWR